MKRIFSLLLVVSMLCAMMITVSADANVAVGFTPSATTVTVGDTFTVDVYANIENATYGVTGVKVVFDTDDTIAEMTALERVGLSDGTMGSAKVSTKTANATSTTVQEESGKWFTATFTAVKAGTFTIAVNTSKSYASYKPVAGGTAAKATDFAPVTVTIVDPAPATPEEPTYGTPVEEKGKDIVVDDVTYKNVFVGEYSATPATGVVISKIGIKYHATDVEAADAVTLSKDVTIDGDAKVTFKAAILGVKADAPLVTKAFTEYAFAD